MDAMTGMTWSKRPSRALLYTGIFELVLAAAFVVGAFVVPVAAGGFYLTAIILGITGVVLVMVGIKAKGRYAEAERLKSTGLDGAGAITGLEQTGVTMNDQPQVKISMMVTVAGREPYPVMVKEYVPMMLLGRLTNGMPLALKVDSANPQNVVIDWQSAGPSMPAGFAGAAGAAAAGQGVIVGKDVPATPELVAQATAAGMLPTESDMEYKRTRLRQFGKPGTAIVQAAQDTGQRLGENQIWVIDLAITVDGVTKDIPAAAAAVEAKDVPNVKVGMVVPIRVDQTNSDEFTLLWDEAKPPA
jgi:hypothetical protein